MNESQSARPRVSVARQTSYDNLESALEHLLAPFGGMPAFVKPGQTVLIKPNLLTDRRPETAVTTHPELVRALIRLVRKAEGSPSVGDSPASTVKVERVYEITGMADMCRQEDVPLVKLEGDGARLVETGGLRFTVSRHVMETDVLISVPKVKSHILTVLTAAVKNLYGVVPGYQKANLHKEHPTPRDFSRILTAIARHVPCALHVADGIVSMEGHGPSSGDAIGTGFLAAAPDPFALDLILCRILEIRPQQVPYLAAAAREYPRDRIELAGDPLDTVQCAGFRHPAAWYGRLIPGPLVRALKRLLWIRPAFGAACTRCGRCVEACPARALCMGDRTPLLEARQCIGCCCCHEICPSRAVSMTASPLLRLLRPGGGGLP